MARVLEMRSRSGRGRWTHPNSSLAVRHRVSRPGSKGDRSKRWQYQPSRAIRPFRSRAVGRLWRGGALPVGTAPVISSAEDDLFGRETKANIEAADKKLREAGMESGGGDGESVSGGSGGSGASMVEESSSAS
ncbi:unnamed protein product [Arabis nemorensis]|uniref:Uncharacterized protein n=1 Tax=Arabis nemorensis TaxID=586526 RepID=A0A565BCY4_9BRAS|nr:unnamed protein product [Arabis nemorensis]